MNSNVRKVVVLGAGDLGEMAAYYFAQSGRTVAAFADSDPKKAGTLLSEIPIVHVEQLRREFPAGKFDAFVAIGYSQMNDVRCQQVAAMKKAGYRLTNCLSPTATVNSPLGENCFVQERVVIQPFVSVGSNTIFWAGTQIGHHSIVGAHTFFAPSVAIAGRVTIGESCFFGVNSTVKNHVQIGDRSLIAAGALVIKDVPPESLVKGIGSQIEPLGDWRSRKI